MFYYAVNKGVKTGVFDSWKECEANIKKYPGAVFKKFPNLEDATDFVKNGRKVIEKEISQPTNTRGINIYTDGSFFIKDGIRCAGYGIFIPYENISISAPLTNYKTNIRAELTAVLSAIKLFKPDKRKILNIHTDSKYCILIFSGTGLKYKSNNYKDNKGIQVKNSDLVAEAMALLDLYQLRFFHVYAHTEENDIHSINNRTVDKLAVRGAMESYIKSIKSFDDYSLSYGKYKGVTLKDIPPDYLKSLLTKDKFEKSCSENERYRIDKEIILKFLE